MLKNEPTLAIVAVDTAENGPSKVHQVTNKVSRNIGAHQARLRGRAPRHPDREAAPDDARAAGENPAKGSARRGGC